MIENLSNPVQSVHDASLVYVELVLEVEQLQLHQHLGVLEDPLLHVQFGVDLR